jgi:DNA transformation protein and related proteins
MAEAETTRREWESTMGGSDIEGRLLTRLSDLGDVTSRPLFGGNGVYWGETIFGILFGDKLYLKVDERSKGDYQARGMGPFRPNERQTLKSYYEVPPEVLDNSEVLRSCARETIRAGMDSQGRARTGKERRMRWP